MTPSDAQSSLAPLLHEAGRVVVKIGSALLVQEESGDIRYDWLDSLAQDLATLVARGQEVIVVSSGAIAVGRRLLALPQKRLRLEEKQATAAAGQIRLAHAYQEALARHDITVAQVLLTLEDTEARRRHLNARNTLNTLLKHRALPVINENDTVATEEIRYGDNDRLAARVAQIVMADGLLLLSDVDGLYDADPQRRADARHVPEVEAVTEEVMSMAAGPASGVGSGGMTTKLLAARIATHAGCSTIVTDGTRERPIAALIAGARHTIFHARGTPAAARKQWLAGALEVRGTLTLDDGAVRALAAGHSLLPVGVTAVSGSFSRGDPVSIAGADGRELGRGLVAYDSSEAARIAGCRSEEIAARLGYPGRATMVHRNDLVLFVNP